jgi:surface-anchored protein
MHRTPRTRAAGGLVGIITLAGALLAPATAAHAADPITLDTGHIDTFSVTADNGALKLQLKEDVTGSHVVREAEDVTLKVKESAFTDQIPAHFPGSPSGYLLPLTQDQDLIWPGWDTNGTAGSGFTDVSINVTEVEGPGEVYLYTLRGFGTVTPLLTNGSLKFPGTLREAAPAHTHAQWTFTKKGVYELTANAVATNPATGQTITSATHTYTFQVGDAPIAPTVSIAALSGHYHSGSPVRLTATSVPAATDAQYAWYIQRTDQSAPVRIDGVSGATHVLTAEQALDAARVTVAQLAGDGTVVATSAAATIHVDDHDAAPLQEVSVTGAADGYSVGDAVNLSATVSPASVLNRYEWTVTKQGETTGTVVPGANSASYSFVASADLAGASISARLTYDDGTPYVASEPVVLDVEVPVDTELSISGLAPSYTVGDTAELTAVQTPQTDEDHYHWFIKRQGDAEYSVIAGATTGRLSYTIGENDDKALIVSKLYTHDHVVITESAPVSLNVVPVEVVDPPVSTKPETAPPTPADDALDGAPRGTVSIVEDVVVPGQTVTVSVGSRLAEDWVSATLFSAAAVLTPEWAQVSSAGEFSIVIPAGTALGEHRVGVFAADGSLIGWDSITVQAVDAAQPVPTVPADPAAPTAPAAPAGTGNGQVAAVNGSSESLASTGAELAPGLVMAFLLIAAGGGFILRRRTVISTD